MTTRDSYAAILKALFEADIATGIYGMQSGTIKVVGVSPMAVANAAKTFKVKMFGANTYKNFVHIEYEPFEGSHLKLLIISRPLNRLSMAAIENRA